MGVLRMLLSVRDVAEILKVSENTIHQWITTRSLPASQVNGVCRFNKVQLLEWPTANHVDIPTTAFRTSFGPTRPDAALIRGCIIPDSRGGGRATILRTRGPPPPLVRASIRPAR